MKESSCLFSSSLNSLDSSMIAAVYGSRLKKESVILSSINFLLALSIFSLKMNSAPHFFRNSKWVRGTVGSNPFFVMTIATLFSYDLLLKNSLSSCELKCVPSLSLLLNYYSKFSYSSPSPASFAFLIAIWISSLAKLSSNFFIRLCKTFKKTLMSDSANKLVFSICLTFADSLV